MTWHRVVNTRAPWGDYGRVLVSGLTTHPGADGRVRVERTGPFVPPITMAGVSDLLVTDGFRKELMNSGMQGFDFREALVKRVVKLDWQSWDTAAPEPARYPAAGEPENYVLRRKHDPAVAALIGTLWEVVINGSSLDADADLVRTGPTHSSRVLASDRAKNWLLAHASDWLSFERHAG